MARNNEFAPNSTVTLCVPKPVIIFNDMGIQEWKSYFAQKISEAITSSDKIQYTKCLKTLMFAECCNCTFAEVRNSKDEHGLYVKLYFEFPDVDCLNVFSRNFHHLELVSKVF